MRNLLFIAGAFFALIAFCPSAPAQAIPAIPSRSAAPPISGSSGPALSAELGAVPELLARLGDSDKGMRLAAIGGLGELHDTRAVESLGAMLLDSREDGDVKLACAKSLGKIGDSRTAQVFIHFLMAPGAGGEDDRVARAYAAMCLGRRGDKAAVDALLKNIDPARESDLNYHCIVALGRIAAPLGLSSLLPLVLKGLPVWTAAPRSRTPAAAYWALLTLQPSLGRRLYLDRWQAQAGEFDTATWFAALYLRGNAGAESAETLRKAWEGYLNTWFSRAVAADCSMVGEALDVFPIPSLLSSAAALMKDLDTYSKSWLAEALIHHPVPAVIPVMCDLLDCEDDFLVYAALAYMERLITELPNPPAPELASRLVEFRRKLPGLSAIQLSDGTMEWRDVVRKRLDSLLGDTH
jgi:hypothetical protein